MAPSTTTTVAASTSAPASEGAAPTTAAGVVGGPTATVVDGIIVADVGTPVTTREGNVVTLHAFEIPVAAPGRDPNRTYAAGDVEACAGEDAKENAGVAPTMFRVEVADNREAPAVEPVKEPALRATRLPPGQCARGWVTFSLPKDVPPRLVAMRTSTQIAWRLRS